MQVCSSRTVVISLKDTVTYPLDGIQCAQNLYRVFYAHRMYVEVVYLQWLANVHSLIINALVDAIGPRLFLDMLSCYC